MLVLDLIIDIMSSVSENIIFLITEVKQLKKKLFLEKKVKLTAFYVSFLKGNRNIGL